MTEDCISRAEAIEISNLLVDNMDICEALKKLPSVQPKPRKGKWIPLYDYDGTRTYEEMYGKLSKCPFCEATDFEGKYCWQCGARLEESEVSDEDSN